MALSFRILVALAAFVLTRPLAAEDFQGSSHAMPYDEDIINYGAQKPTDRIARLQERIANGEVKLKWDEQFGWLPAVLDALQIPKSSQMLVFSRTSLQRRMIDPRNPRAIFYNDDVYVGYIPDAPLMEISAVDPKLGGIFYALEQTPSAKPTFARSQDCLQCHVSGRTLGVPGHFVRSLRTDGGGEMISGTDTGDVTHCTPLADRWGGWYVTGQHGAQTHLGNLVGLSAFDRHSGEPGYRGNIAELSQLLDVSKYPQPHSDIVALMLLEHQAHMQNYITRLNYETQIMTARYGHIRYLKSQVNAFLRYLLFTEEIRLSASVRGNAQYVADFTARGPRDTKGRSLRDLDLQTRLFRFPCSYLIYSEAFDQMPAMMREHLLQRLNDILTGKDEDPQFAGIAASDREAILEILRETKPNLPEYWRTAPEPPARSVTEDAAMLQKGRIRAQQNALMRLGAQTDPRADEVLLAQFQRLDADQLPYALWLELLEAASKRDNPALKTRLAERERALDKITDPLVRYRECLAGGDREAGRKIFTTKVEAGCVRCHAVDGQGGQIGPELTWLRHSVERVHLLESILLPDAVVAPGYAHALLKLSSGEDVSGVVTVENADDLTLTSVTDGKQRQIRTANIVQRTPLPSPMPPSFGTILTKREIRDLIEFLAEGD